MDILFSANNNYVHCSKVFLYSICDNHIEKDIDFWLAYSDISEHGICELQEVISLFQNKKLHLLNIGNTFSERIKGNTILPAETFYRILAIDLLPKDMDKILYLDVDMVIKGDISEVFNIPLENHPFGVCEDMNANIACVDVHGTSKIPNDKKYFNAGTLLMNLDYLRKNNYVEHILSRFINEYQNFFYLDQDILNNEFYDSVLFIPWEKYNLHPSLYHLDLYAISDNEIKFATYNDMNNKCEDYDKRYKDITDIIIKNASIVHYISDSKPWKHRDDEMYWVHALYKDYWLDYERKMLDSLSQN
ncbi:glycosyltransferase family 8 protein [Agathobacter sp.]